MPKAKMTIQLGMNICCMRHAVHYRAETPADRCETHMLQQLRLDAGIRADTGKGGNMENLEGCTTLGRYVCQPPRYHTILDNREYWSPAHSSPGLARQRRFTPFRRYPILTTEMDRNVILVNAGGNVEASVESPLNDSGPFDPILAWITAEEDPLSYFGWFGRPATRVLMSDSVENLRKRRLDTEGSDVRSAILTDEDLHRIEVDPAELATRCRIFSNGRAVSLDDMASRDSERTRPCIYEECRAVIQNRSPAATRGGKPVDGSAALKRNVHQDAHEPSTDYVDRFFLRQPLNHHIVLSR